MSKTKSHKRTSNRYRHWQDSLKEIIYPADEESNASNADIGNRLRELRNSRGLSIRSLAKMAGLNFNTLSLIENKKSSPSVSTLNQLAQALRVPITTFFESDIPQPEVVYQIAGERPKSNFSHGLVEDLGSGLTLGNGIPLLLTLDPGANSSDEPVVHTGQEFVYCLEGVLTYTIEGKEFDLHAGDSLIFHSHLPHQWGNKGRIRSLSILILCPDKEDYRSRELHLMSGNAED